MATERADARLTALEAADAAVFVDTNTTDLTSVLAGSFGATDVVTTGDLEGAGVLFNGDTADANRLNDYEEGDWTPVLVGSTTSGSHTYHVAGQAGRYVKVGQIVTAVGRTILATKGNIAGNLSITGLPFATVGSPHSVGSIGYAANVSITAAETICTYLNQGGTKFTLYIWNTSSGTAAFSATEINGTFDIMYTATYKSS